MAETTSTTEAVHVLHLTHGTSKGRETYGYSIVTLRDAEGGPRFRCMGGGYDMVGTVLADWMTATYPERMLQLARDGRAYSTTRDGERTRADEREVRARGWEALYGMHYDRDRGTVSVDGACGENSVRRIAEAAGLTVRTLTSPKGRTVGFTVTAERQR